MEIEQKNVLAMLQSVPSVFVPTGSRRFNKSDCDSSDYDFVGNGENWNTESWGKWAHIHKFSVIFDRAASHYVDNDTTIILRRSFRPFRLSSLSFCDDRSHVIEVSISVKYHNKVRVLNYLDTKPEIMKHYYTVPKNQRSKIWNKLAVLAAEGKI